MNVNVRAAGAPTRLDTRQGRGMSDEAGDDEEQCEVCGEAWWSEGNWMLLCDGAGCERAYHTKCLKPALEAVPEGDWLCPVCVPPPDGENAICNACGEGWWAEGNEMLLCDGAECERAYHTKCLRPPLDAVPEGDWLCPSCAPSADDESSVCYACGEGWWAEGNEMLLCDGAGCERAYHTKCLVPALGAVPEGDWLCPSCARQMAPEPSVPPEVAPCVRAVAWSSAWHAAHARAASAEGARAARKEFFAATTTLGTLLAGERDCH